VIGYRLVPPAEEEMTEAALFYEAARTGLGDYSLMISSALSTQCGSDHTSASPCHMGSDVR
jgi:hypothetical protein